MEVKTNSLQKQVDNQIEARLFHVCHEEWVSHKNKNPKSWRKKPVTYSESVRTLLELRQSLYNGEDPEAVSATVVNLYL